jgi:Haem-binding domain
MKKALKWAAVAILVLFVAAQAYRPDLSGPPVDETKTMRATARLTPEVGATFDRACNDCHSSKTDWPWYSQLAPVSWYLKNHVDEGRRELSFSEWGTYPRRKASVKLKEICDQVSEGEMPLKSYLLMHPAAKLSDADKKLICDWTEQERKRTADAPPQTEQPTQGADGSGTGVKR